MNMPKGFRYAARYAGIRKVAKDDLALIVSDEPASAAAVFTRNRVVAAPVTLSRNNLRVARGRVRAILVNAGNANCATRTGEAVAQCSAQAVANALGIKPHEVLAASTGVIGVELDAHKIVDAMPALAVSLSANSFPEVAHAMMTTDTFAKMAHGELRGIQIAGCTKGSGMIQPNMATTLGFVMTDARISAAVLRPILKRAIARTYNRISVDGDTSTNDMVAVLANGASGVKPGLKAFEAALTGVLESLSEQIARDGEGARKLVIIDVEGAPSESGAEKMARAIANSPLVKTAIAGSDPNWGRIITAAGYSGVVFDPSKMDIDMQGIPVCRGGVAADFSEQELTQKLDAKECFIRVMIRGRGKGKARFRTCDFTEGYIRINGSYRT